MRIVDQEQVRLGILREIALRDELPVAGEIGKADGLVVDDVQKPCGPAAMLDVRLAVGAGGREKALVCAAMKPARSGVIRVCQPPFAPRVHKPGASPCGPAPP
jgi:hypothetical protein